MASSPRHSTRAQRLIGPLIAIGMILLAAIAGLLWVQHLNDEADDDLGDPQSSIPSSPGGTDSVTTEPSAPTSSSTSGADGAVARVVVVSIDGLGSAYVSEQATPTVARLLDEGAGTLNARTEVDYTLTLPNHTGMVTGRPVDADDDGHGVTWNTDSDRLVLDGVESVFSVVADADLDSAVFAGKSKFEMWGRAWPDTIDPLTLEERQPKLVREAVTSIEEQDDALTFVHLAGPDTVGHRSGWGSDAHDRAVSAADRNLSRIARAADREGDIALIVTADHGGVPGETEHGDAEAPENYTIPFVVWGPGIAEGDLYELNDDYRDPGTAQPSYDETQPVRNADVANLVTDLLGLPAVPGSVLNARQDLTAVAS